MVSSGSPPLMSIPLVAPTPVPTITAVGVAKPRAQGQAIANTVIANWKALANTLSACKLADVVVYNKNMRSVT